jgi:metal-dependent amidase/aminoacylase/carboxypeptidase family protein
VIRSCRLRPLARSALRQPHLAAGNSPWSTKDPIVTAAQIITNLQSIVSRQTNLSEGAAVISVGQFNAGNRINIIPEEASFSGTSRTLNEVADSGGRGCNAHGAEGGRKRREVKINRGTPVLYNDPDLALRLLPALERAAFAATLSAAGVETVRLPPRSPEPGGSTAVKPGRLRAPMSNQAHVGCRPSVT